MIRVYREADIEQILDIWYEASVIAHSFLDDDFLKTERQKNVDSYLPMSETYIRERDDKRETTKSWGSSRYSA